MHAKKRKRVKQGDQQHDQSHDMSAEIVGEHFGRGDVTEPAAEDPLAFQEEDADQGDGNRTERKGSEREAIAKNHRGKTDRGPTGERRHSGGDHEHPRGNLAFGEEKGLGGSRAARAVGAPKDAISAIEGKKHEEPDERLGHDRRRP